MLQPRHSTSTSSTQPGGAWGSPRGGGHSKAHAYTGLDAAELGTQLDDEVSERHARRPTRHAGGSGSARVRAWFKALAAGLGVLLLLWTAVRGRGCACDDEQHTPAALEQELAAGAHPAPSLVGLTDLLVVAGHAVFVGTDFSKLDMESWYLEPYQQVPGVVDTFMEHIRVGVRETAANPNALLLFSGGATRAAAGPLSEALSYYRVASAAGWFGHADNDAASSLVARIHTEEFARDSYENLLFSLCRFHELTGGWPVNVSVIGYDFKRERFLNYHRAAVDFPMSRFHYIGTPAPHGHEEEAMTGESHVLQAWGADPYGCGQELHEKRVSRDPFARGVAYFGRCAALHGLLNHCGPEPYAKKLPWG
jgi:hypothetical protein